MVPYEQRAAVLAGTGTGNSSTSNTADAKADAKATTTDTTSDADATAAAKAEKAEKDRLLKVYADKYKARHCKKLSYGKHVDTAVSLIGLLKANKRNNRITEIRGSHSSNTVNTIPGLMLEIENLGHESLAEQPPELTVELYEHQKQGVQWMIEQERLEHGPQSYLWGDFPLPQPKAGQKLWFSPVLDVFTAHDPFTKPTKGALLCDELLYCNACSARLIVDLCGNNSATLHMCIYKMLVFE
eukprot:4058-Heterococcus_DN1.PRE.1